MRCVKKWYLSLVIIIVTVLCTACFKGFVSTRDFTDLPYGIWKCNELDMEIVIDTPNNVEHGTIMLDGKKYDVVVFWPEDNRLISIEYEYLGYDEYGEAVYIGDFNYIICGSYRIQEDMMTIKSQSDTLTFQKVKEIDPYDQEYKREFYVNYGASELTSVIFDSTDVANKDRHLASDEIEQIVPILNGKEILQESEGVYTTSSGIYLFYYYVMLDQEGSTIVKIEEDTNEKGYRDGYLTLSEDEITILRDIMEAHRTS